MSLTSPILWLLIGGAAFDVCIGKVIDYELILPDELMNAIRPYEDTLLDEDVHDLHEVQRRLRA